jgi:predicted transcriptional regulator
MSQVVSFKVSDSLGARIDRMAANTGRPAEEVIATALDAADRPSFVERLFGRAAGESPLERQLRLQLQHAERIRALEMGLPLPEIERLRLETLRKLSDNRSASIYFFILGFALAPAAICGIATGATGVVLSLSAPDSQQLYLAFVWTASAFIAVATDAGLAVFGILALRPLVASTPTVDFEAESTSDPPRKSREY